MSHPTPLTLTQMLLEMDKALADEIEAKSKYRQRKHHAINGVVISEEDGQYIYQFTMTEPWDFQDDTPLIVVNKTEHIGCTVINMVGTLLTISSDQILPPELLQGIDLCDDSTKLLERQRKALKNVDEGKARLASKSFGLIPPYQQCAESRNVVFGSKMPRENQRLAASMSLSGEVTFIIGPPGTGKTLTLAAIAFHHLEAGHTVLIAAHTNIAVDNAIMKLCELSQETGKQYLLGQGQVVRYGAVQKKELKDDQRYADVYLPKIAQRLGKEFHQERDFVQADLNQVESQLSMLRQPQTDMDELRDKQGILRIELDQVQQELTFLEQKEHQRLASLEVQCSHYYNHIQDLNREIDLASQQLGRYEEQKHSLESEQQQEHQRKLQLLAQQADARAMSQLKRILKRINLDDLNNRVAQYSHKIYELQQYVINLQPQFVALHQFLAAKKQEQKECEGTYNELWREKSLLSEDGKSIIALQEQRARKQQLLAEGKDELSVKAQRFQRDQKALKDQQILLRERLGMLDQRLRDIERSIVQNACIVGTTLTKTYMNSTIAERRFDVVILDEVSMAPMPLLSIATAHADHSVTLIGDPQQLSPIAEAKTKMAEDWLKKDLFSNRNISLSTASHKAQHSIMLDVQSRMHPRIAAIVNDIVYQGKLRDDYNESKLQKINPCPDSPLVLCDTHDASPIVSQPPNGSSRLNHYHALCCMAIARQALTSLAKANKETGPRIGIITPYRPQAHLIQKLVKEANFQHEIQAGTVHRFQGLEFDIVIFDTVESPVLDPAPFISGSTGSESMRIMNVAITRARHKLFVVANQHYLQQKMRKDSTLWQIVTRVGQAERIHSLDIVGVSFRTIIERAGKQQSLSTNNISSLLTHVPLEQEILVLKSVVTSDRGSQKLESSANSASKEEQDIIHLTEQTFYAMFEQDLRRARHSVFIASAYITSQRYKHFKLLLLELRKKGVEIKILTRPLAEKKDNWDREGTQRMIDDGFTFIFSSNMHQKVVIIDESILYDGSLNVLSHKDTKESIKRIINNKEVTKSTIQTTTEGSVAQSARDFILSPDQMQKLKEVKVPIHDLPSTSSTCLCGSERMPRLRRDGTGAFYGCQKYSPISRSDHNVKSILLSDMQKVKLLQNQPCPQCNDLLVLNEIIQQQQFLLECVNPQCSEKQRVVFVS